MRSSVMLPSPSRLLLLALLSSSGALAFVIPETTPTTPVPITPTTLIPIGGALPTFTLGVKVPQPEFRHERHHHGRDRFPFLPDWSSEETTTTVDTTETSTFEETTTSGDISSLPWTDDATTLPTTEVSLPADDVTVPPESTESSPATVSSTPEPSTYLPTPSPSTESPSTDFSILPVTSETTPLPTETSTESVILLPSTDAPTTSTVLSTTVSSSSTAVPSSTTVSPCLPCATPSPKQPSPTDDDFTVIFFPDHLTHFPPIDGVLILPPNADVATAAPSSPDQEFVPCGHVIDRFPRLAQDGEEPHYNFILRHEQQQPESSTTRGYALEQPQVFLPPPATTPGYDKEQRQDFLLTTTRGYNQEQRLQFLPPVTTRGYHQELPLDFLPRASTREMYGAPVMQTPPPARALPGQDTPARYGNPARLETVLSPVPRESRPVYTAQPMLPAPARDPVTYL